MADPSIGGLSAKDFYLEAGNSGLKVFGGYVVEDFDPTLRGIRGMRILREMQDTDPTVGAILFVIGQSIRKIDWHVSPADQSIPSLLAQELFESMLDDMDHTWSEFIAELCSMFTYGFAPFEIVLKERKGANAEKSKSSRFKDGMIGIRKLALRGQDTILRWIFDADNNDVIGLVQMPWTGGIRTIPIEKLLLFRTISTKNNPEGRSLLRNAYRPYYFRKRIEEIEAVGIERDLAGLPVMMVPGELIAAATGPTPDPMAVASLNGYKQLVTNIRRNTQEGVVIPSTKDATGKPMFELSLLNSGGQRQFDTSKIIDRYTQSIATVTMADFLLLGHSSRGGQALGTSKVDMFYSAIEGMVQQVLATLNADLVPLLGTMNGIPEKYWPKFFADKAEQIDLGRLGAYINALAASGMQMFPDKELEGYLRDVAGLPEVSEEQQQQNEQMQQLNQHAEAAQNIATIHASTAQATGSQMDTQMMRQGKPPMSMGGGGGAPGKPQGSFGGPRKVGGGGGGMNKRRLFDDRMAA